MFRLRRAFYDIEIDTRTERPGVEDTKDKLLDSYRSQNEELKKVNTELQKEKDSFNTERQELQGRIELLGKHFFLHDFVYNDDNLSWLHQQHSNVGIVHCDGKQIFELASLILCRLPQPFLRISNLVSCRYQQRL